MDPAAALEEVFARWAIRTRAPSLAWGLVRGDELVATGGAAEDVFRIASMTKSFTGAALMTLVDEGRCRLDDPVAQHVPALAAWRGPTADAPPLTIRHLVSMESGLPTDDPWADRHLDMTEAEMDDVIAEGATFAWTPGIAFEYSNLGWGLVGRVIRSVAGVSTRSLVSTRLLAPLEMSSTTWTRPETQAVAEPFGRRGAAPVREAEPIGDGELAPMGGLWSTVGDLARWVSFFLDAWPPRDDPDDGPLPRWARREMQQARRTDTVEQVRPRPDGPSRTIAIGYGIGLAVRHDPRLGVVVGHSGGLPGYGSHMRWIPDRAIGVIACANISYANMTAACSEALEVLADLEALGTRWAPEPRDELRDAASRSAALLASWSDEAATALFADNVASDEPLERRAAAAAGMVARHGPIEVSALDAETPLRGSFTAASGLVTAELGLEHTGRVQWLDVTDRSEPPEDRPLIVHGPVLAGAVGTAYVVLRPAGDLEDRFIALQGQVLDRLAGAPATVPAAHVTMKAFGSSGAPIGAPDEGAIVTVVAAWAAATPPIELRAEAVEVFDGEERVPIVRLAAAPLASAMRDLWDRAAAARLRAGYSDPIGVDTWVPHLSLLYLGEDLSEGRWGEVAAWARAADAAGAACVARAADLVIFDGGPERRVGRFPLAG